MPEITGHESAQRPAASADAWTIDILASRLCDVRRRGQTPYCVIHGNVVGTGTSMCGHVRHVVDQLVGMAVDAERRRAAATDVATVVSPDRWAS